MIAIAVAALLVAGAVVVVLWPEREPAGSEAVAALDIPSEVEGVVGQDGFDLEVAGARVTGPAGVADVGTEVRVARVPGELGDFGAFAAEKADAVRVELGEAEQPDEPITITFDDVPSRATAVAPAAASDVSAPSDEAGSRAATSPSDVFDLVVATSPDGGVEFADAQFEGEQLVVVTDHLSDFTPAQTTLSDFGTWFEKELQIAIKISTRQPPCFVAPDAPDAPDADDADDNLGSDAEAATSGVADGAQWVFSEIRREQAWPCVDVREDGDELRVSIQNNTPGVWHVSATAADDAVVTPLSGTALGLVSGTTAALAGAVGGPDSSAMVPDGTANFRVTDPEGPIEFTAQYNVGATYAVAVFAALADLIPAAKFRQIEKADCAVDVFATALTTGDEFAGEYVATITNCVGTVLEGLGGSLVSALAAIPAAGAASFEASLRPFIDDTTWDATLSNADAPLAGLDPFLGTWRGTVDQFGDEYTLLVDITPVDDKGRVALAFYRELGPCAGAWVRPRFQSEVLVMTERLLPNLRGTCFDGSRTTLTPDGPDRLLYDSEDGAATAVLTRDTSGLTAAGEIARGAPAADATEDWPIARDDGWPALYAWAGANLLDFPEWVACDEARTHCLVGGITEHMVLEAEDMIVLGAINNNSSDPAAALGEAGVPPAAIADILN